MCRIVGPSSSEARFVSWTKTPLPLSSPLLASSSVSTAKIKTLLLNSSTWAIQIESVKKSDEGTYHCNAAEGSNATLISDRVFIKVTAPPVIAAYSTAALEGLPATLVCNGSNYRIISWKFRNRLISSGVAGRSEKLTFARVSRDQNGRYSCTARNKMGASFAYADLTVYVPPEVTEQPVSTPVQLGKSAEITCSIAGNPRPLVVWLTGHNVVVQQSSRISIRVVSYTANETRSKLTIRKTTAEDDGCYYCHAIVSGVGAVDSKLAKLTVKRSSHKVITFLTAHKTLFVGRRSVLKCGDGGNSVTWHKEHKELDFEHQHRFQKTRKENLVIDNVALSDAGTYECRIHIAAVNINLSQTINVTVIGPPGQPKNVGVSILKTSQVAILIRVNWTRPSSNGNLDLTGFIVYYRLTSPLETIWKIGSNARDSFQTSALIRSDGVYSFFRSALLEIKVEAVNRAGSRNSTPILLFSNNSFPPGTSSTSPPVINLISSAQASQSRPTFFFLCCFVALFWFFPLQSGRDFGILTLFLCT
ncbi:probable oxidoreductase PXDNL isoform X2 [Oscarella lobularis]